MDGGKRVSKIIIYTGPVKVSHRRGVDVDHAVQILDLLRRGYHVSVRDPDSWWSCSFSRTNGTPEKPVFVNQPDGTYHSIQFRPHKGTEDARLLDEAYPEWMNKLIRHIKNICPPEIHLNFNEYQGASNG